MANERLREQNTEKVLNAAYELFIECGIEMTTISMIAKRAGVTSRSVFRYFHSKDNLICLTVIRHYNSIRDIIIAREGCEDYIRANGLEQFLILIRCLLCTALEESKPLAMINEIEVYLTRQSESRVLELFREHDAASTAAFERWINKGIADGSIRPDIITDETVLLFIKLHLRGMLRRIALMNLNNDIESPELITKVIEFYISEIAHTLSSEPTAVIPPCAAEGQYKDR